MSGGGSSEPGPDAGSRNAAASGAAVAEGADTGAPLLSGYLRADGRKGLRNVWSSRIWSSARITSRVDRAAAIATATSTSSAFPAAIPTPTRSTLLRDAVHASQRRRGTAGVAGLRGLRPAPISAAPSPPPAARSSLLVIQESGGTRRSLAAGRAWVADTLAGSRPRRASPSCRGRADGRHHLRRVDATSGLTANPAIGHAYDRLVGDGGARRCSPKTGELIGMETSWPHARRGSETAPELIRRSVAKATRYYATMGHASSRRATPTAG